MAKAKKTVVKFKREIVQKPEDLNKTGGGFGTYKIVVEFTRREADDAECLGFDPEQGAPTKDLVHQFVKELQCSYDCESCMLAGHFQVLFTERPILPKPAKKAKKAKR